MSRQETNLFKSTQGATYIVKKVGSHAQILPYQKSGTKPTYRFDGKLRFSFIIDRVLHQKRTRQKPATLISSYSFSGRPQSRLHHQMRKPGLPLHCCKSLHHYWWSSLYSSRLGHHPRYNPEGLEAIMILAKNSGRLTQQRIIWTFTRNSFLSEEGGEASRSVGWHFD